MRRSPRWLTPFEDTLRAASAELGISAAFTDYRQAIDHPGVDAIVIATPTSLHREVTEAAAAAGKHVFCEKPMAMKTEDCDAMIRATEQAGVVLQIGFMRRFDRSFQDAKARVEAGEIGEVVQVKTCTHGPSYPRPWMFDLAVSNGPLAEVNSHDIDTVRWFSGSEFTEVYAIAANYRTPEAKAGYPDFYDQVLLSARMANGSQGSISGAQGRTVCLRRPVRDSGHARVDHHRQPQRQRSDGLQQGEVSVTTVHGFVDESVPRRLSPRRHGIYRLYPQRSTGAGRRGATGGRRLPW